MVNIISILERFERLDQSGNVPSKSISLSNDLQPTPICSSVVSAHRVVGIVHTKLFLWSSSSKRLLNPIRSGSSHEKKFSPNLNVSN